MERSKAIENLMRIRHMHDQRVFGAINDEEDEALAMAIEALEQAPTALDHIHNVVKDDAYRRGYEQGKADANHPEIPDSWVPVKAHPATDEEQESSPDIDYWFDCEMPDDEQEILVTVKHKNWVSVEKDVCYVDSCYGLDSGYDWLDDIIAWMPLPEPYKEGE